MAKLQIRLVNDSGDNFPCGEIYEMTEEEADDVYDLIRDYANTHAAITVHPNNLIGGPVLRPDDPPSGG